MVVDGGGGRIISQMEEIHFVFFGTYYQFNVARTCPGSLFKF